MIKAAPRTSLSRSVVILLFTLALAGTLVVNLAGTSHAIPGAGGVDCQIDHGWPLVFLVRESDSSRTQQYAIAAYRVRVMTTARELLDGQPLPSDVVFYPPRLSDNFIRLSPKLFVKLSPIRFGVNALLCLALSIAFAVSFAKVLKTDGRRFSTRGLMVLVGIIGLVTWIYTADLVHWSTALNLISIGLCAVPLNAVAFITIRSKLRMMRDAC